MSKRLKFFLSHLAISFLLALIVVGLVFFIWYPSPLAKAVGVTHIFLMMLAIDVIIGPLLGLLIYKEGKKTLKMDLGIIILIQISALGYGVYSIAQGRPAWLAYYVDNFQVVRNNEILDQDIEKALPQYQQPERYVPLDKVKNQIQQRAQNLDVLNQFNDKALVEKILSKYPQATAFVPLKANAVDMTVLINKEKGEVVKIVDLRPWK